MKTTQLTNRNEFATLLKNMGLTGKAAEIGVAEGYFSHYLLDRWPGSVVQIDPWAVQTTPGYSLHGEEDQEARYQRMLKKATQYPGRCHVVRATSITAAPMFADRMFDFVYLDAIHTLEAAREDVDLWWPKVKPGGVFAGHDYLNGVFHGQNYGVKQAVDEFAAKWDLTVNVTAETDWPSWWVVRP